MVRIATQAADALARDQEDSELTRSWEQPGSLPYMAPEQLAGGRNVDIRTDVDALGVTLYELPALDRPFKGRTPAELVSSIQKGAAPSLRRSRSAPSWDVAMVCMTAMEAEPLLRESVDTLASSGIAPMLAGRYARNLSVLLCNLKSYEEAVRYSRTAIRLRSDARGQPTPLAAHCLLTLARAEMGRNDFAAALEPARQSVALNTEARHRAGVAYGRRDLGRIHYSLGQWQEALDAWDPCLPFFAAQSSGAGLQNRLWLLERRAVCHEKLEQHAQAAKAWEQAADARAKAEPGRPEGVVTLLIRAGRAWMKHPDKAAATRCLQKAIELGDPDGAGVRTARDLLRSVASGGVDH